VYRSAPTSLRRASAGNHRITRIVARRPTGIRATDADARQHGEAVSVCAFHIAGGRIARRHPSDRPVCGIRPTALLAASAALFRIRAVDRRGGCGGLQRMRQTCP
jgi:hypothetical protein